MLTRIKDTLPTGKESNWYHIPCSCGQVYIRVTKTYTGDWTEGTLRCLQEGDDREVGCGRACMGEPPSHQLEGDTGSGQGQRQRELLLKKVLHIQMTPAEDRFNWDRGLEIWGC